MMFTFFAYLEDFHQRSPVQAHREHKDAELVRRDAIIQQQRQVTPLYYCRVIVSLASRLVLELAVPIRFDYVFSGR